MNSCLLKTKRGNVQKGLGRCSSLGFCDFRKRRSSFSLDLRPFGSSFLGGARSKVDLRGEGYSWITI